MPIASSRGATQGIDVQVNDQICDLANIVEGLCVGVVCLTRAGSKERNLSQTRREIEAKHIRSAIRFLGSATFSKGEGKVLGSSSSTCEKQ